MGRNPKQGKSRSFSPKVNWNRIPQVSRAEENRILNLLKSTEPKESAPISTINDPSLAIPKPERYPKCKHEDGCMNRRGSCGMCREHCMCEEK